MRRLFFGCVAILVAFSARAQKPLAFDVENIPTGTQRIPTLYFYAAGKWSDAGEHIGLDSAEILCYKALGFCNVASAQWVGTQADVSLTSFDILRWDDTEIIAVNSSPICVMNTIRADLKMKTVSISSTSKGARSDSYCKGMDKLPTAMLLGPNDVFKLREEREHSPSR